MPPPVPERIFPNPVNDMLTIEMVLDEPTDLVFSLLNTLGQRLIRLEHSKTPSGRFSTTVPCQHLAKGAYILEIRHQKRHSFHYFVKY